MLQEQGSRSSSYSDAADALTVDAEPYQGADAGGLEHETDGIASACGVLLMMSAADPRRREEVQARFVMRECSVSALRLDVRSYA